MRVSVDKVMSWEPCVEYTLERVTKLFGKRKTVSALNILDMDIPPEDRLWAVLHEELIPAPTLHELACRFAESALRAERKAGRDPDPRSWAAIEAKRAWLRGEITGKQLSAAESAAESAAWLAARLASESAAESAAWLAAESAAWSATWSATWSAARLAQVEMVREILGE